MQTFGGFGAKNLGRRSSDSLQPRLSHYGPSALKRFDVSCAFCVAWLIEIFNPRYLPKIGSPETLVKA